jgi:phosphoenolpyruvate-protein phosphotransferase
VKDLLLYGRAISAGYAQGEAVLWGQDRARVCDRSIGDDEIAHELRRFQRALEKSRAELRRLSERVSSELGSAEAEIFSAHLLFLQDPQFIERVEHAVRQHQVCVESAVSNAVDELAAMLRGADNEYLREREEDLRDLGQRVLRHVTGSDQAKLRRLGRPAVLVARELLPSDLLEVDRRHLAGILTEVGGEVGHAAILARALGIPAVTGIPEATRRAHTGMRVLLNGQTGAVVFDPSPARRRRFASQRAAFDQSRKKAEAADRLACVTRDGTSIALQANIGREWEVGSVMEQRLEGVGLFRTEYLFLDAARAPSLDCHYELYRRVAARLNGRTLVIRTLDLGGDKFPAFLAPRFEANPNLGVRGLRFSLLAAEDLFRTQIRAIVRLSRELSVRILLPMVLGGSDIGDAIARIRQFAEEEGSGELPPVGALIETPAAIFAIGDILRRADFVSIGTNDLTQFILAADRNALATIDDYTALHPSVLRAIRQVVQAAAAAAKPVSVCGEAAADPRFACLLVGLGVRTLSMNPISASRVRYAIRALSLPTLTDLAEAALSSDSPHQVSSLLDQHLSGPLGDILGGHAPAVEVA